MNSENNHIPLDIFIDDALYNKNKGYYMTKKPFGKHGDFITAPNISILFSEMVAIWLVSIWEKLGSPKELSIVELGAGNGEMMFNILNVLKKFSSMNYASNFYILEISPVLKKSQMEKIRNEKVKWIDSVKNLPKRPTIFLSNEFFDSFPVKQFFKLNNKWFERYIIFRNNNYQLSKKKVTKKNIEKLFEDKISSNSKFLEFSPKAFVFLNSIGKFVKKYGGAILIIDYGYKKEKMKNTIQSLKNHKKNYFLQNVYNADITHLINFDVYKKKLKKLKLGNIKITNQRKFLLNLGILDRAEIISKNLKFSEKSNIYFRVKRLIDDDKMGSLFKVLFASSLKNKNIIGF